MKYYFGDNREYGAEDVKTAMGVIAAKGGIAIDLGDGTEYDVSALNRIVGSAVAAGVVPDENSSMRLSRTDGGYRVSPGRAIFSDGGIAVLDEEETVNIQPGQYLYLAYSTVLDDVYFLASDDEKSEGGGTLLVPLAYVTADGSVESRRKYAEGKIPALASARWSTLRDEEFLIDISSLGSSGGAVECVHEFEGEMNFMMVNGTTHIGLMYIGDSIKYHTVHRDNSREGGNVNTCIYIKNGINGYISGTFVEKGDGYVKMRYKLPSGFSGSTVKYTATIGLIK